MHINPHLRQSNVVCWHNTYSCG